MKIFEFMNSWDCAKGSGVRGERCWVPGYWFQVPGSRFTLVIKKRFRFQVSCCLLLGAGCWVSGLPFVNLADNLNASNIFRVRGVPFWRWIYERYCYNN